MSTRELIGWALVAGSGVFAVAAAFVKGGLFEALTAASTACAGAAAMWGYTNKPPAGK